MIRNSDDSLRKQLQLITGRKQLEIASEIGVEPDDTFLRSDLEVTA
jgi:hypothetical protein